MVALVLSTSVPFIHTKRLFMPGIIARACGDDTTCPTARHIGRMKTTAAADNAEVGAPAVLDESPSDGGALPVHSSRPTPSSRRAFPQGEAMTRRQITSLAATTLVVMTVAAPTPASAQL